MRDPKERTNGKPPQPAPVHYMTVVTLRDAFGLAVVAALIAVALVVALTGHKEVRDAGA